jgi:hypothetical protein
MGRKIFCAKAQSAKILAQKIGRKGQSYALWPYK